MTTAPSHAEPSAATNSDDTDTDEQRAAALARAILIDLLGHALVRHRESERASHAGTATEPQRVR